MNKNDKNLKGIRPCNKPPKEDDLAYKGIVKTESIIKIPTCEKMKKNKFNAKKIVRNETTFDSKREYTWWLRLQREQELGHISELRRQVPFTLIDKSEWGREIRYIADFVYKDENGEWVIADVKGLETPVFKLKSRLFSEKYKIKIKILK